MPDHDSRREYQRRIHHAQDYIESHLGERLSLERIAQAACFSPFHFHRLYTALTGEPLHAFILRVRLERAAVLLACHPERPVTDIALTCGFGSAAAFARAFRAASGCSASEYRKKCLADGKEGQASAAQGIYAAGLPLDPLTRRMPMPAAEHIHPLSIAVSPLPARSLAYIRHIGPYTSDCALFERLFAEIAAWAEPRGLLAGEPEFITIYHDNPDITAADKLRISVGVSVPLGTVPSGRINVLEIPAGEYVCARFEIASDEFAAAWRHVCADWLPQSGWQPADDGLCHESYLNDPQTHPQGKHLVDIRIPVRPL